MPIDKRIGISSRKQLTQYSHSVGHTETMKLFSACDSNGVTNSCHSGQIRQPHEKAHHLGFSLGRIQFKLSVIEEKKEGQLRERLHHRENPSKTSV